ncbi:hypothetical protein VZT92_008571 [Zoarces viviparus]|uniref:Uncharacterized protein n=1 Tax=Zoarces viviparus TaxID=48416 RepID=A0AAW1FIJ5_ZOAVI
MYTGLPRARPVSEKDLRMLKGPRHGKRRADLTGGSQELTVCLGPSANPVSHFADYAHFPRPRWRYSTGRVDREAGSH